MRDEFISPLLAERLRNFTWKPWHPHRVLHHRPEPIGQRVERLRAALKTAKLGDRHFIGELIAQLAIHGIGQTRRELPEPLFKAAVTLAADLAAQNNQLIELPEIEDRSRTADEAAFLTDLLDEVETRLQHEQRIRDYFLHSVASLIIGYVNELAPRAASSPFSVPLYTFDDPAAVVARTILTFTDAFMPEADSVLALAFLETRKQLFENVLAVSKLTFEQYQKTPHKIVAPKDCELPPNEMLAAYLGGTPLLEFLQTPAPFAIPRSAYGEHGAIFAPSGHGKTQLLQAIIHGFLEEEDPPGLFIMDSQGDEEGIIRKIERLQVFHPEHGRLKDRLLIIDPEDASGLPALNFFKLGKTRSGYDPQVDELFQYLFTAIDSELTTKQGTAVTYLLRLMAEIPDATIETLKDVMEVQARSFEQSPFAAQIGRLDKTTQDFFRNQFYGGSMKDTRVQVCRRLYTLLANPLFTQMFSAHVNRFDAFQAMQEKKIVLINTSSRALGERISPVFGRYFIAQILAAALQRGALPAGAARPLALLIIDEAHEYLDQKTEMLLRQARKFSLGMLAATQQLGEIEADVKGALNANTAIKLAGPVAYADATALAREMYCAPDFLREMRKTSAQTEFACYVRGLIPRAIQLTVPFGALERAPRMDAAAHARMRESNRRAVGVQNAPTDPAPPNAPAARKQQLNELSLRDTDLPLPDDDADWHSGLV